IAAFVPQIAEDLVVRDRLVERILQVILGRAATWLSVWSGLKQPIAKNGAHQLHEIRVAVGGAPDALGTAGRIDVRKPRYRPLHEFDRGCVVEIADSALHAADEA